MAVDPYYTVANFVPGAFSTAEMAAIESLGDSTLAEGAPAVSLPRGAQTEFIYARLGDIAQSLNAQIYQFDIRGFGDLVRYQVDRPGLSASTQWRMDQAAAGVHPKLRLTALLSDPSNYTGGVFEGHGRPTVSQMPDTRGGVIVFPFHTLHRVTPVLSGARKTLTVLISGARLR